jgi:hypothetical protein
VFRVFTPSNNPPHFSDARGERLSACGAIAAERDAVLVAVSCTPAGRNLSGSVPRGRVRAVTYLSWDYASGSMKPVLLLAALCLWSCASSNAGGDASVDSGINVGLDSGFGLGPDSATPGLCLLRTPSTAQSLTFPHSGSS